MEIKLRFALTTLFACFISAMALAAAPTYTLTWTMDGQAGQSSARVASTEENGNRLIFLALESPVADLKEVEQNIDDQWVPVAVKPQAGKSYIMLSFKKAELHLKQNDGKVVNFSYEVQPGPSALQIAGNCKQMNFVQKATPVVNTGFPAMLNCQSKDGNPQAVVFSSLAEAEWFGSAAFEMDGKGERWKVFAYKDISSLNDGWQLSWGDPQNKSSAIVNVNKPKKVTPPTPKPAFTFQVGASYISGTVTKDTVNGKITGLQIPLRVSYQKEKSWWFFGSSYNFFVYSLKKGTNGTSNSTSDLGIWGGAEYAGGAFHARGLLGYANRSLDTEGNGGASSFEAPLMGVEFLYDKKSSVWGLFATSEQTSAGGKYTEMNMGLYYQTKIFFKKEQRIQLSTTQLKATTPDSDLKANWINLGINFEF